MADAHKNFAYTTIATAPSPATTGTSLVVAAGTGKLFPTAPFNAICWPAEVQPLSTNAEIVRVTAVATDTFTIARKQESTTAQTITAGFQIDAGITVKTLTDAENLTQAEKERYIVRTPEEFGATHTAGHDDAPAITEAIEKAVAECVSNKSYYCEVVFGAHVYNIERAPILGGAGEGNSQIPLPVISPATSEKVTLVLRGVLDATAGPHWRQEKPQESGTVLNSTLTTGVSDATWGVPSVMGGPTKFKDPTGGRAFSNMQLVTNGITITQQKNPVVIGCDARQIACHNIIKMCTMVRATPTELATLPTNELGIGVYMPLTGNNDNNNIDWYTSYGHYTGLVCSEHTTAQRIAIIYGNKNLTIVGVKNEGAGTGLAGEAQHGGYIQYLSSEGAKTCHIEAVGTTATKFPLIIGLMSCESNEGSFDIVDPENTLFGEIRWENITPSVSVPRLSGGKNLKVLDTFKTPGPQTPPAVPATTVAKQNPFWRDCFVNVIGGTVTVIEVNGVVWGSTSGMVPVPSGAEIKLTYSVAPTWKWTAM